MKIQVDVDQAMLATLQEWIPCQAFRLREREDGAFALVVTNQLKEAREADLDIRVQAERLRRQGTLAPLSTLKEAI